MKRNAVVGTLILIALLAASITPLGSDRKAKELLQSAQIEEFLGNVNKAIELYSQSEKEAGGNHALASQALLLMGQAYQKTDKAKAALIFKTILAKYGDQQSAVQARKYINNFNTKESARSVSSTDQLADKLVLIGERYTADAYVSFDGQFIAFVDPSAAGDLQIHYLSTGIDRTLVKSSNGQILAPVISRDARQVAYAMNTIDGSHELRVVDIDGTQNRTLLENTVVSYQPRDWTTAGDILTVVSRRSRGTLQVSLVNSVTAHQIDLSTFGLQEPGNLSLSLDGRFVAFDFQDEKSKDRDIFVSRAQVPFEEKSIVRRDGNDAVLGWSPDGRWLLFANNRTGQSDVYAIDTVEGRAAGSEPLRVISGLGSIRPLGITRSGSLFFIAAGQEIRKVENFLPEIARLQIAAVQRPIVAPDLASIDGIVVKAGTTEPIAGVNIELTRMEGTSTSPLSPGATEIFTQLSGPVTLANLAKPAPTPAVAAEVQYARTAENGRFVFRNLKPGGYRLVSSPTSESMFYPAQYGQRDPRGEGMILPVADGQTLQNVKLEMAPTGTVIGRVFGADGQGLGHAMVYAIRVMYQNGQRGMYIASRRLTNERGDYRLFGLPPGRYYVAAQLEEKSQVFFTTRSIGGEFIGSPIVTRRFLDGEVIEETYGLVYSGGGLDPNFARPIDITPASASVAGVDISMAEGRYRSHHIRGTLINGVTGQPATAVQVRAVPLKQSPYSAVPFDITNSEGIFDLSGLSPGKYFLVTGNFSNPAQASGGAQGGRGGAVADAPISGLLIVEMVNEDINNLRFVADGPFRLQGSVALEGRGSDNNSALSKIGVNLTWDPNSLGMPGTAAASSPPASSRVANDGKFNLQVSKGNYRVNVTDLPSNLYVKSIRLGAEDVLSHGLALTRAPDSQLEILVSPLVGEVQGTVVDSQLVLMPNVIVALVPDSVMLRDRPDLYRSARTDAAGRFSISAVAPGDYKLFAWEFVERGVWYDPQFLQTYESSGKRIRIIEGKSPDERITVSPLKK